MKLLSSLKSACVRGFEKSKKFFGVAIGVVLALAGSTSEAALTGLDVVKEGATGNVEFAPEALAQPVADAIMSTAKWVGVIALIVIGVYVVIKMIRGR